MARNGNDWRSGGQSSRGRKAATAKRPDPSANEPPAKEPHAPAPTKDRSDWRQKKTGGNDQAKSGARANKDYLQRRDQPQRQKTFRHRMKVGAWTGMALLLVGVLLYYLMNRPQQVTLIEVIVTEYQDPVPPNSYALEDGTLLDSLESTNDQSIRIDKEMDATRPKGEFLAGLENVIKAVKPGGPNNDTYLVYLSAHGVVNEENEPCLLLSGGDPLDSSQWLPIVDVLELLGKIESPDKTETVKVLILDSGRINEFWEGGLLYNGFADALSRTVKAADVKNLYVLHSCSPGERNWSGPELNGSAFGHYVARGLNGAADLNEDYRISLYELQVYVRMRVNQWAGFHRGANQNPQLIPALKKNTRVLLAYRRWWLSEPPALVDAAPVENSLKLNELWLEHERLLDDVKPYRYDPVGWAQLQEDMLRLESLLLAGNAYRDSFESLMAEVANQQRVLSGQQSLNPIGPINLPLSEQLHGLDYASATIGPLQQVMSDQANNIPHDVEKGPPPVPGSYQEALTAAWLWLLDPDTGDLTQDRLLAAQDMIEQAPALLSPAEPIEGHFLRMLTNHLDWQGQQSLLSPLLRQALATRNTAELAATPADERTFYWLQEEVDEGDQQRRLAEDHLFVGSSYDLADAQKKLSAAGRNPEEGHYGKALDEAQQLAAAFDTRDRVWSEMRYLVAWSLGQMQAGSPGLKGEMQSLLENSHKLGIALDRGEQLETINGLRTQVEDARSKILDSYRERVRKLNYTSSVDENTMGQILAVLRLPLYTGTHRNELRRKLIETLAHSESDRANAETIEKPQEILKAYRVLDEWAPTDDAYLASLAALSEHPALTMVDPGKLGVPDAVNWSTPRQALSASGADPGSARARQAAIASLAEQGADLRRQLLGVIEGANDRGHLDRLYQITRQKMGNEYQTDTLDARHGLSTADRLCRAAGPLMPKLLTRSIRRAGIDPTTALRKIDRYFQCLWLADRCMNDFWGPGIDQNGYYFEVVAKDLLASAARLQPSARFQQYGDRQLGPKLTAFVKAADESMTLSAREIATSSNAQQARLSGSIQSKPFLPAGVAAVSLTSQTGQLFPLQVSSEIRRRLPFEVGPQGRNESINHAILPIGDADTELARQYRVVLRSFFRGHQFSSEIHTQDGEVPPNTIVTLYEPIRPPEVLVQGDVQQIPSVLFVFDCSLSMNEPASGEQESTRMVVARQRLLDLLGPNIHGDFRLPDQRFRVGLMLYGNNVGWERVKSTQELRKRYSGFPSPNKYELSSLQPSLDVDTVVPITLLNESVRAEMAHYMAKAQPWGQTPLYYSIQQALERFEEDRAPDDAPRQIVVLTDGADDPGPRAVSPVSALDILKLLAEPQYKSVRIDIVAFDFKVEDEVDDKGKPKVGLATLARKTGGTVHQVTESAALEAAFDELLTPIKYHVQQASLKQRFPEEAQPLGVRAPIDEWNYAEVDRNREQAQYKVDLFGATQPPSNTDGLELLGGEALVMEYNQDNRFNRLEHLEYAPDEFTEGDTRTTQTSPTKNDPQRKFLIKAFVPKRELNELQFDLAVQHAKFWPFTPRPSRMWVEIRPADVSSNSEDPLVFNFFDQTLVPGKPVPVYRYTIQEWPKKASEAKVRVWALFDDLPPDYSENISMNDDQFELTNATLRQQLPGTQFSVKIESAGQQNPYRVIVTETIAPEGQLHGTCVDMWPRPDTVVHSYQGNQAEHKFVYNKGVQTKPRLDIWSRRSIEEEAVPLDDMKPMRVRVPELLN